MYISIDIGGTNTRIASSENLKDISELTIFDSIHSLPEQKAKIEETINILAGGRPIEGICVGVPGVVVRETSAIQRAPNYPELNGVLLSDLLSAFSGSKLVLENDAALGALSEAVRGSGVGYYSVAYLTLGTGVGGALIENSEINKNRKVSEPGHMIINFDNTASDNLGYVGSLEAYTSGLSFENLYGQKADTCVDRGIWLRYGNNLATGISNIVLLWGPDIIVIGGGISDKVEYFIDGVSSKLKDYNFFAPPKIVKSAFEDKSGVIGGFVQLEQLLKS